MTKEALKLALEALESGVTTQNSRLDWIEYDSELVEQAITAIKEALANEALEKMAENARELGLDYEPEQDGECKYCTDGCPACDARKLPTQEPVAWNVVDPTGKIVATEMNSVRGWARIEGYKPTVEGLLGFHEQGWRVVPTTPPQRKWVGLDDEDMKELRDTNFDLLYGARWAERKLREKNT